MSATVLIVSGLRREAAILAGPGRTTIYGDAPTLRAKLTEVADRRPSLVMSWGLCGGLDPRLRPGDLILGAEIVSDGDAVKTDEAVTKSLALSLGIAGARVAVERLAGADAPVLTAVAKARLRCATGAAGVDMESLIAGRFALEHEIPFAILRAVADPAERDLPSVALKAVDSDGRIRAAPLIGALVRSPGQFAALCAAAVDSRAAFQALNCCRSLLSGLFGGLGPMHL